MKIVIPEFHHHFIDRLAFFNGIVSGVALYPQVWAVLSSGSSLGVSLPTFIIILLNSLVWLTYSIHRGLISLAIASIFHFIASTILVVAIIYF
ncbi:MAG: hypothetical protein NUV78_00030 [Candidatus Zambryskibacteria bacterium]|nr:hypothetical protein [Candidatus Zambryskibacteria bacterium]